MKRCPSCNRTYTDASLNFCLEDGTPLVSDVPPPADLNATMRYSEPRRTREPPPTEIYRQEQPLRNQVPEMAQPRPSAPQGFQGPQMGARQKSNAIWWILGVVAVVGVVGIGLIIMILALAGMNSNENGNNGNSNSRVANRNRNSNANQPANVNSNTSTDLPRSFTDDFSTERWRTGNFQFGDIWYAGGEYHMRAKEKTYLVMYASSSEYSTENAAVRLTARSVDGNGPASGFGLIVHGQKSTGNELEDYALLIFTGDEPQYEVVMHKGGNQKTLIPWTKSSAIRSGTSANQLEIRSEGDQLSFYINGRYLTRITDNENFKRGVAGLYTSETAEVVFDDLEIIR